MSRTKRYITNVFWNSASVGVLLIVGFVMSPFILRHIGETNYGEWTLVISLVEYYWLMDLGFRSATIKFSAEFNAVNEGEKLGELVSTGLVYSMLAGVIVILASLFLADKIAAIWHIDQPEFPRLLRIVGVSWGVGMVFNIFGGCLEGFQRFDVLSRIWILTTLARSVAVAVVLKLGYGVVAMGWVLFTMQLASYLATWLAFRGVLREVRVSLFRGSKAMLKRIAGYGVHMLTAQIATRLMSYSVPAVIAYLLPLKFLAYWSLPVKIMDYAFDGIGRIGMVTTPNAAEFAAQGDMARVRELGMHANRYCFALYVPYAVFLLVYGRQAFTLWVRKPDFVPHSVFLIPILLIGYAAAAGQFNSSAVLFGLGKHRTFVRFLLIESILTAGGVALVIPYYGLAGAAWVITVLMALNRGVAVAVIFSRQVQLNPLVYMARIYTRPSILGAGMAALLFLLRRFWLPGDTWLQVVGALAIAGTAYCVLTAVFVLSPYHREQLLQKVAPWLQIQPRAA